MVVRTRLMWVGCTVIWTHSKVQIHSASQGCLGLWSCFGWGPGWCPCSTEDHVQGLCWILKPCWYCGLLYLPKPYRYEWPVLLPEAKLMFIVLVASEDLFWVCGPSAAQVSAVPRKQVEAHDSSTLDYKEQRCNLCSDMNDCVCRVEREGYAKLLWQPLPL